MKYFFDPHARQELMDATLYLSNVDPSLGKDFADEVERTIALIYSFPKLGLGLPRQREGAGPKDFRTHSSIVFGTNGLRSSQ